MTEDTKVHDRFLARSRCIATGTPVSVFVVVGIKAVLAQGLVGQVAFRASRRCSTLGASIATGIRTGIVVVATKQVVVAAGNGIVVVGNRGVGRRRRDALVV